MTTQIKPVASQLIAEFCGPSNVNGISDQKPVTGQEVITQLAIDHLRSTKPLLDTPTPLPEGVQHLIVSYLPYEHQTSSGCTIEALCEQTGNAFLRHFQAVACVEQQFKTTMVIRFNNIVTPSSSLGNDMRLNPSPTSYRWETQHSLNLISCSYNDDQLEELLTHFNNVENLFITKCKNLYSLKGLSCLPNLKSLDFFEMEHLQNSSWKDYIPLNQWHLADAKPNIPCFDLAALKLPKLESLKITADSLAELRVIDAKNCKQLKKLNALHMNIHGNSPFANLIIDVRGLKCEVYDGGNLYFEGEDFSRKWTVVLKD